jgi:hypothetical protein
MVSKWWTRRIRGDLAEKPHQSNVYAESNRSNFWQIFGDLTSMQTLAIYPRLVVKD